MSKPGLTHLDALGRPHMVDVGAKADTERMARARGFVRMGPEAFGLARDGGARKGDVLAIARLAGIQGAKRAAELIPLCHPLPIDAVELVVEPEPLPEGGRIRIEATVRTRWRTGVEMEAFTAVTAAALTVYDMLKGVDRQMAIEEIVLLEKSGGRSGAFRRDREER